MVIAEAIEILTEFNVTWSQATQKEKRLAIKLGIEALKAVINARANNYYTPINTLPGETED